MDQHDVLSGVQDCLATALDMRADSILPDDKLVDDLGADSLDLLDLTFQLEQRFKVPISPRDIERRTKSELGGRPLEVNGVYTPEAIQKFRESMPEVPAEELPDGLAVVDLPRRFRVATMVNLVQRLLEERNE